MWRIRRFIESVSNLIYYFKVIWNDRDWDFSFIEYILLKKLEKVYKRYSNKEYFQDQDKTTVQPLRICIEILKRKDGEFYYNMDNYLLRHKGKLMIYYSEERDHRVLYYLLEKYSQYWWD